MTADYEKSLEKENEKLRLQLAKVEEDYDTLQEAYKLRCGDPKLTTQTISNNGIVTSNGLHQNSYDLTNSMRIVPNTYLSAPGTQVTDKHFKFLADHYEEFQEFKKAGLWKKIKMIFFTKRT